MAVVYSSLLGQLQATGALGPIHKPPCPSVMPVPKWFSREVEREGRLGHDPPPSALCFLMVEQQLS